MRNATGVCVPDGFADGYKMLEQFPKLQIALDRGIVFAVQVIGIDGLLESHTFHEGHDIKWAACFCLSHAMNRDHAWMIQATGNLCFNQKTIPIVIVGDMACLQTLDSDLAVELWVLSHIDLTDRTLGMFLEPRQLNVS